MDAGAESRKRLCSNRFRPSAASLDLGLDVSERDHVHVSEGLPTPHLEARVGLRQSIANVLKHDGFDSSSPEAMEGFTSLVETYMVSFIKDIKMTALAARREQPTPVDFEMALKRFNLPLSSLRPHRKHRPAAQASRPANGDATGIYSDALATLPLLGPELSGKFDKDQKPYIPGSFPDFPSRHTYSFTPQDAVRTRDSKRTREEAARAAQLGEDALRRLVRASKMRKQKEAKTLVEKDSEGKERFRLWEMTMRRFMSLDSRGELADEIEIADHSMIVNGEAMFSRKEVPRFHKRSNGHKT